MTVFDPAFPAKVTCILEVFEIDPGAPQVPVGPLGFLGFFLGTSVVHRSTPRVSQVPLGTPEFMRLFLVDTLWASQVSL